MSVSDFKIDTAIKAIPNFTGNYKELDSFLVITKIINDSLNASGKLELLKFVFHVKLSNNVKTAIGNNTEPQSYEALAKLLKERYKSNITLPKILNKLANIVQRNLSIVAYKELILNTINELTKIQIEQLGEAATNEQKQAINITNDMQALQIFKSGLNDYIRPTVTAARPSTLADAINIALEVESNDQATQIMHFRANNQHQYSNYSQRYNQNNNNSIRNNNNNNNNNRFQQNSNNRYQNRNSYQQNNGQTYHNNNNRNQYNNNKNYRSSNQQNYNTNRYQQNRYKQNNNQNRYQQNNNNNRNNNSNNRPERIHMTQAENCLGLDQEDPESQ